MSEMTPEQRERKIALLRDYRREACEEASRLRAEAWRAEDEALEWDRQILWLVAQRKT